MVSVYGLEEFILKKWEKFTHSPVLVYVSEVNALTV